jgi:hypothetical protein
MIELFDEQAYDPVQYGVARGTVRIPPTIGVRLVFECRPLLFQENDHLLDLGAPAVRIVADDADRL